MGDVVEFGKQEEVNETSDRVVESIQIAAKILTESSRPFLILVSGAEGQMYCNTNLSGIFATAILVQMAGKILGDILKELVQDESTKEVDPNAPAPEQGV